MCGRKAKKLMLRRELGEEKHETRNVRNLGNVFLEKMNYALKLRLALLKHIKE